ncbi:Tetratricopeptide TPR_2 repeat-containing protein [Desulfovibrio sp. X2]|uniref:tetratricopeptide repeat protein n=1 Tax=Desulfovibrio sp. X2 TaxID=941449 RepID=UPI000358C255|nr:tetratricopeptide repeat protein [Desulfovibrio sp. X2]EPR41968.1 Tetratricopeptide TPR_2 repeat-containing protein [Desulfovibrio sp. X2]
MGDKDRARTRTAKVGRVRGIFSSLADGGPADGAGGRLSGEVYWKAEELDDGNVCLQRMGEDWVPRGRVVIMPKERLFNDFKLEPGIWYELVNLRLASGDAHRSQGRMHEAQIDYARVTAVDEENIRANFGLGLVYLSLGQLQKAAYVFETLIDLEGTFSPEHKHLFNEFGIALRKRGLSDKTLRYYNKALELAPDDENLLFNLARCHFERGDEAAFFDHLGRALAIAPKHPESLRLLRHAQKCGLRPPGR